MRERIRKYLEWGARVASAILVLGLAIFFISELNSCKADLAKERADRKANALNPANCKDHVMSWRKTTCTNVAHKIVVEDTVTLCRCQDTQP